MIIRSTYPNSSDSNPRHQLIATLSIVLLNYKIHVSFISVFSKLSTSIPFKPIKQFVDFLGCVGDTDQ